MSEYNVLLIGGRGSIGSGLRTYLPRLDNRYRIVSIDLPGAEDKATESDAQQEFVDLDILDDPEAFRTLVPGHHLVVYLAAHRDLAITNQMADLVFETSLAQRPPPMIIASSSVHAVDQAYNFFRDGAYALIAARRFDEIQAWPAPIPATMPACPINDYGLQKAYVESWVKRAADQGHSAIAARWGGVNPKNNVLVSEAAFFSVWCHQEDAARFVHAAFMAHLEGSLVNGAHYFVVSNNTYSIFDIETPAKEIGYRPIHNAESFYQKK